VTEREKVILEVATQLAHAELSGASHATVFNLDTQEVVKCAGMLVGEVLDYCADDAAEKDHPLEALAAEAPEGPSLREALRQVGRALRRKFAT
jgi:hypothetical protein